MTETSKHPLQVLAWPAYRNRANNPYNALLYTAMEEQGLAEVTEFRISRLFIRRFDIFHVHWPMTIVQQPEILKSFRDLLLFVLCLTLLRLRGTRVVWTAHNEKRREPEHPILAELLWFWFIRQVDGVLVLTEASKQILLTQFPRLSKVDVTVTPHGHYRDAYPNTITKEEARTKLGLSQDETVIVFLGLIRPYKNLPHLISTFQEIRDTNIRLVVAGAVAAPYTVTEIEEIGKHDSRIVMNLGFVADSELQVYLNAADLLVSPYRNILNSGSLFLALSFSRPILVPDLGSMAAMKNHFGDAWIKVFDGELDAATLHASALEARDMEPSVVDPSLLWEWKDTALETATLYRSCLSH